MVVPEDGLTSEIKLQRNNRHQTDTKLIDGERGVHVALLDFDYPTLSSLSIGLANSRMAPQKSSVSKKKFSATTSVGAARTIGRQSHNTVSRIVSPKDVAAIAAFLLPDRRTRAASG